MYILVVYDFQPRRSLASRLAGDNKLSDQISTSIDEVVFEVKSKKTVCQQLCHIKSKNSN